MNSQLLDPHLNEPFDEDVNSNPTDAFEIVSVAVHEPAPVTTISGIAFTVVGN